MRNRTVYLRSAEQVHLWMYCCAQDRHLQLTPKAEVSFPLEDTRPALSMVMPIRLTVREQDMVG